MNLPIADENSPQRYITIHVKTNRNYFLQTTISEDFNLHSKILEEKYVDVGHP